MPLFSIDTSSRGPCVRYRMDLSINYLQFLHRIVYVVAQRFLRAWRSPRHLLVNNGLNSNDPLTRFGILALENSASECCIGLFLVFLSRSFIISIRMLDCSILALSDQGYIHWSNRADSFSQRDLSQRIRIRPSNMFYLIKIIYILLNRCQSWW